MKLSFMSLPLIQQGIQFLSHHRWMLNQAVIFSQLVGRIFLLLFRDHGYLLFQHLECRLELSASSLSHAN